VLSGFARLLRSQIRENEDMAFRLGGDEFAILAPNTSSEELEKLMQRIVNVVRNAHFDIGDVQIRFTLSVGISQSHDKLSMADIIKRADTALYRAKENGRDRIIRFQ
jgi:two-component system cell cycle response regulator